MFCPTNKEKIVKALFDEGYLISIELSNPKMIGDTSTLIEDVRTALVRELRLELTNPNKNKQLNK